MGGVFVYREPDVIVVVLPAALNAQIPQVFHALTGAVGLIPEAVVEKRPLPGIHHHGVAQSVAVLEVHRPVTAVLVLGVHSVHHILRPIDFLPQLRFRAAQGQLRGGHDLHEFGRAVEIPAQGIAPGHCPAVFQLVFQPDVKICPRLPAACFLQQRVPHLILPAVEGFPVVGKNRLDLLPVRHLQGLPAVISIYRLHGYGHHLVLLGHPADHLEYVGIDAADRQGAQHQNPRQGQKQSLAEHPGGAPQEHQPGDIAHNQPQWEEEILGDRFKIHQAHPQVDESRHHQGVHHQKHRCQPRIGQQVPGAFQLPSAVQELGKGDEPHPHQSTGHGRHPKSAPLHAVIVIDAGGRRVQIVFQRGKVASPVHHHCGADIGHPVDVCLCAVGQRGEDLRAEPIHQYGKEIEHSVGKYHAHPVARQLHGNQCSTQIKQVLQARRRQGHQRRGGNLSGHHQRGKRINQHIGHNGKQHTGNQVCAEEAVPGYGHGVQRVAQPWCQKIPPQGLYYRQGIKAVDEHHMPRPGGKQPHHFRVGILGALPGGTDAHQSEQGQHQCVAAPERRVADDVRFQYGFVTEGYFQSHETHLPLHK